MSDFKGFGEMGANICFYLPEFFINPVKSRKIKSN
ncbi:hypothetical protein ABIE50_000087 [Chitinophaga sp. OAE865]